MKTQIAAGNGKSSPNKGNATEDCEQETRICPECNRQVSRDRMKWTHDRYGNPWKKVCPRCKKRVEQEISDFQFDPRYAGEHLEPEEW